MDKILFFIGLCSMQLHAAEIDFVARKIVSIAYHTIEKSTKWEKYETGGSFNFDEAYKTKQEYEIIMRDNVPAYLVTPQGSAKLIGTVFGNFDDAIPELKEELDLRFIEQASPFSLTVNGQRYAVGGKIVVALRSKAKL